MTTKEIMDTSSAALLLTDDETAAFREHAEGMIPGTTSTFAAGSRVAVIDRGFNVDGQPFFTCVSHPNGPAAAPVVTPVAPVVQSIPPITPPTSGIKPINQPIPSTS